MHMQILVLSLGYIKRRVLSVKYVIVEVVFLSLVFKRTFCFEKDFSSYPRLSRADMASHVSEVL